MNRIRNERGFTLVETMVALVVLAIGGWGVMSMLAEDGYGRAAREAHLAAERIARNEVERLEVAGAWSGPAAGASERVDERGVADPEGDYVVTIAAARTCNGGEWQPDRDPAATSPGGCPAERSSVRYTVTVAYPAGAAARTLTREVWLAGTEPASGSWSFATQ